MIYAIKTTYFNNIVGNTVTVMSPDGKPIHVNAGALQAAAAQNLAGMLGTLKKSNKNSLIRNCQ